MIDPNAFVFKRVETREEMAKVVEVPCWNDVLTAVRLARVVEPVTRRFPVVVAPPEIVSPPACDPLPIVDEPSPRKPLENVRTVEVALLGNRYAKFASPRDEVLVSE